MCNCIKKCKCQQNYCQPIIINQPSQIQPTYKWEPRDCCCERNNNNGGVNNLLLGLLIGERNNRGINTIWGDEKGINRDIRYDDYHDYSYKHHKHHKHHHHIYDDYKYSKIIYALPPPYYPGFIY